MRVLLAIDGSASSAAACQLTASLPWPGGSVIHVLGVSEDEESDWLDGPDADFMVAIRETVEQLRAAGLNARRLVVPGRPASLIVDVANDLGAELVIVGSRGRGPLTSMLLGSVSAEVVDHAPCPVFVVRSPAASRVLLAVDGSAAANSAVAFLASTRFLTGCRLEVLTVAAARSRVPVDMLSPFPGVPPEAPDDALVGQVRAETQAAMAAATLARAGHDVRWSVSQGGAAHEILAAAEAFGSELVVLGSRGLTGLSRLVLGSVARNVLLHTDASVLIVHEPLREGSAEFVQRPREVTTPEGSLTLPR